MLVFGKIGLEDHLEQECRLECTSEGQNDSCGWGGHGSVLTFTENTFREMGPKQTSPFH